jgi:ubiquinone/menaquinone biosynthesis C-methylase UbiE
MSRRTDEKMGGDETTAKTDHQRLVDDHFRRASSYWKDVYGESSLFGTIYQERRALALEWIDRLELPRESRALEIGCGAGLLSVDLVGRGFKVDAIDSSDAMVELTNRQAEAAGIGDRFSASLGDAHSLDYPSQTFRIVVAVGVLPFLHSPGLAIAEMARVLTPGGYALFTSDNKYRLNHFLEPLLSPPLGPARRAVKVVLEAVPGLPTRPRQPSAYRLTSGRDIRRWLAQAGLTEARFRTLGFGPFSMFRRPLLGEDAGIKVHQRLQALADRDVPLLRSSGSQQIVLAFRP